MAKTRTQKATLNITTTAVYEIVTFICGLVLPRLILKNYGSEYNGIVSSITQFLSLISVLRLGVAGATRVALYKTLAEGDDAATSAIVRATERYMRKIGYVIIGYIAVLAILYPLFTDTGIGHFEIAILVVAVGIGTFAQYFFGITYQTFLNADQSVYIYNISQIICTVLNTAVSALLIFAGWSIQVVKLGTSVIFFVTPLILNVYVTNKYKLDKKSEPDYKALSMRRDVMASSIANIVHENTDIIVLTVFCNVKIVSVYTVYNLVMAALRKILTIFTTGTEAIFGNMWAKKQYDSMKRNLSVYEYAIGSFVSVVISATIMLILPFVSLYTKGITDTDYILPQYAFIITIAMACYCFRAPYLTMVQGVGRYKETKHGAYFEAALNLISSIILVQLIGITGTAVGTLLANIFRSLQYAFYIDNHIIKRGKLVIIKRFLWITCNISAICLLCNFTLSGSIIDSWIKWIKHGFLIVTIAFSITLVSSVLFYKKDFKYLFNIFKRMIKVKGVK